MPLQFVKFCLVGSLSASIDLGAFAWFRSRGIPRLLANNLSFVLAVTNGFFWNRRWTFRACDRRQIRHQYLSFFIVNVIGFLLNTTILQILAHTLEAAGMPTRRAEMFSKMAAAPIVAIWNFSASTRWAFSGRQPREEEPW